MSKRGRSHDAENALGVMRNALELIRARSDCDYIDTPRADRPLPCPCPHCEAERALEFTSGGWRFLGAMAGRLEHNPRERRIVESWSKSIDDHRLSQILDSRDKDDSLRIRECPSPRDWYVATSVVQWLATTVGMSVLEGAGFKYTLWDADRAMEKANADK